MKFCPEEILDFLKLKFQFPESPLFGVVATSLNGENCTRMMKIYDIDSEGQVILLSHTHSKKWTELSKNPHVSICCVSDDKLCQVMLKGKCLLATKKEMPKKAEEYWEKIRPDVKMIYNSNYIPENPLKEIPSLEIPKEVPLNSGLIIIRPNYWETLKLTMPYPESVRTRFICKDSIWNQEIIGVG